LRAVAVIAVMGFHAGPFSGGFLGVDLFFALSGFLITSLLIEGWVRDHGTFDRRQFLVRRARRLLPALVVYVAACAVLVLAIEGRSGLKHWFGNGASALLGVNNLARLARPRLDSGYAGHLWSLSIEQQFYLAYAFVFPVVVAAARRARSVLTGALLLLVCIGLWRLRLTVEAGRFERAYLGTDTRLDAILAGCVGAFLVNLRATRRATLRVVGHAAVLWIVPVLLAAMMVTVPKPGARSYLQYGGATVFALGAALLTMALSAQPAHPVSRLLAVRPLQWLGRISYSLYLWHLGVFFAVGRFLHHGATRLVARFAISIVVADASYRFVEVPFRRRRQQAGALPPVAPQPTAS
jgi:peptidoglycan/LPS O-acetylase OafA/YrhL